MSTGHLLASQVEAVWQAIESVGFRRTDFHWDEADDSFAGYLGSSSPAIVHSKSNFFVVFARVPLEWLVQHRAAGRFDGGEHWIQFAPGEETPLETKRELKWGEVIEQVKRWATFVAREINPTPDPAGQENEGFLAKSDVMPMSSGQIVQKQAARRHFLQELYRITGDNTRERVRWEDFVSGLWLSKTEAETITSYLVKEGLIQRANSTHIAIAHAGIRLVEDELLRYQPEGSSKMMRRPPPEILDSLARFTSDYPQMRTAFIIMRFGSSRLHREITQAIRSALQPYGIPALRADDKEYHEDLFTNILTYLYGCSFGVAVFERIETNDFNPNISLEVGYLLALGKPICLLKDRTLQTLHTDLVGKLYRQFDPHDASATIPRELKRWLSDKNLI